MTEDDIEEHIALTEADGFELPLAADAVTTRRLFADGGDGKEKEATLRSHHAGASSDAPASSGIPSAERQHEVNSDPYEAQSDTSAGIRDIPVKPNVEP